MSRKMKDSGIEWIGEIPEDWEIIKVKDAFYRKNIKANKENPVILSLSRSGVKIRDISNNEGQLAADYSNYNPVAIDDLLLNPMDLISGDNCNISKVEGVISPAYINLRYKKGTNPELYNYYFKNLYWGNVFFAHGKGVSYENRWTLNYETLSQMKIPYPPKNEQDRIAKFLNSKLNKLEDIKSTIYDEIETLENYKKSLITEAVTKGLDKNVEMKDSGIEWIGKIPKHWKVKRIKNLGTCRNGLTYSPSETCDEKDGILVLRSSNVQNGKIELNNNVYVNKIIPDDLMVKDGDILICSRNGSRELIGKNAIIENIEATFGAFMMIYRSESPKLMYYVLNSNIFQYYLGSFFTSTINQLTNSNFENMKIVWCEDIEEQEKIVEYLDEKTKLIDETISLKQKQLESLEEYKKSLIYEYVTGKKEV